MMGEVRVVDPKSGGMKGSKDARFDCIPPDVLWELAEHYGKGLVKYADVDGIPNWQRGYDWRLSVAALHRHINLWQQGEDFDDWSWDEELQDWVEGTHSSHLISVIWHLVALRWFQLHNKGTDYREVKPRLGLQKPGDNSELKAIKSVYTDDSKIENYRYLDSSLVDKDYVQPLDPPTNIVLVRFKDNSRGQLLHIDIPRHHDGVFWVIKSYRANGDPYAFVLKQSLDGERNNYGELKVSGLNVLAKIHVRQTSPGVTTDMVIPWQSCTP